MSGKIGRIIVGLDGSDGSAAALGWAVDLAKAADAEVVAVHVFELPYPLNVPAAGGAALGVSAELVSFQESMRDTVRKTFQTVWCAPLAQSGVRYRDVFEDGRAGPVLVEVANREHADLIVTG